MEKNIDSGVIALINKMQQQLVFLEKKIDILISQSSQRPSAAKGYGKTRQGNSFKERNLVKVTCAECNQECEVPFRPSGNRPVYCRDCFSKHRDSAPAFGKPKGGPRKKKFSR